MKFFGPAMRAVAPVFVFSVAVCFVSAAFAQHASQSQVPAPAAAPTPAPGRAKKPAAPAAPAYAPSDASTKQLEQLTRALKPTNAAAAYAKLSAFALRAGCDVVEAGAKR
jgi:hypothetical protein